MNVTTRPLRRKSFVVPKYPLGATPFLFSVGQEKGRDHDRWIVNVREIHLAEGRLNYEICEAFEESCRNWPFCSYKKEFVEGCKKALVCWLFAV